MVVLKVVFSIISKWVYKYLNKQANSGFEPEESITPKLEALPVS